ncbi:MAG TPA: hypothetical protein PKD85_23820 [Saprospiraceae bacterium]|nr:hypothetical protein [Saprospiraceae bacterium]
MIDHTWKLKVGVRKEYEAVVGVHTTNDASLLTHNDRRVIYKKHIEYFEEKTFNAKEDLLRYMNNMYPNVDEFVIQIYRKNMLGDWCSESWFEI